MLVFATQDYAVNRFWAADSAGDRVWAADLERRLPAGSEHKLPADSEHSLVADSTGECVWGAYSRHTLAADSAGVRIWAAEQLRVRFKFLISPSAFGLESFFLCQSSVKKI